MKPQDADSGSDHSENFVDDLSELSHIDQGGLSRRNLTVSELCFNRIKEPETYKQVMDYIDVNVPDNMTDTFPNLKKIEIMTDRFNDGQFNEVMQFEQKLTSDGTF